MMPVSETDPASMSNETANDSCLVTSTPVESKPELIQDEAVSKEKHSSKENYYIKKRIIAAINRSFKSNDKSIQHTFALNDDEKNDSKSDSRNLQSITIIVKRIDLDKESILYTKEKAIPDVINLEAFKVKEISSSDTKPNSNHSRGDTKPISNHSSGDTKTNSNPSSGDTKTNSNHSSGDTKADSNHSSGGTKPNSNHSTEKKRSSDDHHRSDRHHSSSHHRSSGKHRSDRRYHMSEETSKSPYLVCYNCGRKESKKWVHPDCTNKCCRSTSYYCDSCLRRKVVKNDFNNELIREVHFNKYMYVVGCPFGRGNSLHMDYDRIMHLRSSEQRELAVEFFKQAFKEDDKGFAQFTIAIVHNGAKYMPDILKMLAKIHPSLKVNTTKLKSSTETELTDLMTYYKKVKETYNNGTYAFDPLNETQAACVKNLDECGGYLPEILSLLEKSPFLSQVLPWGDLTTKRYKTPHESDDGPIFWCRPGEQIVSLDRNSQRNRWNSNEIENFLKERKKNMCLNDEKKMIVEELKKYRRSCSSREFLFEDRTRPHADQAWSNSFEATAAVGVIQAIHPDENPDFNRICKEIVVFQAKHLEMLEALLHIDVTAAPKQQCAEWLDDAKLNMIRQMNIKFSKLHLRDNDIYFIPRKIVHQFKTVSATLSIAWHTRILEYYETKPEAQINNVNVPSTPKKEEKKIKSKTNNSRSRSSSAGSRGRLSSSKQTPRKRKQAPPQSPSSSNKKIKEEPPSSPNGAVSKKSIQDSSTIIPDCCCLKTPVKLEPASQLDNDQSNAECECPNSIELVCPKVNLLNLSKHKQCVDNPAVSEGVPQMASVPGTVCSSASSLGISTESNSETELMK